MKVKSQLFYKCLSEAARKKGNPGSIKEKEAHKVG